MSPVFSSSFSTFSCLHICVIFLCSLFPELGASADKHKFFPSVNKPSELGQTGATTAKGDTKGETQEDLDTEVSKDDDDKTRRKKKRKKEKKQKKKKPRDNEDVALDIRPELAQAKDILVRMKFIVNVCRVCHFFCRGSFQLENMLNKIWSFAGFKFNLGTFGSEKKQWFDKWTFRSVSSDLQEKYVVNHVLFSFSLMWCMLVLFTEWTSRWCWASHEISQASRMGETSEESAQTTGELNQV